MEKTIMMTWRKSSYSTDNGNCVEIAWRKSSRSASHSNCVEIGWRKSSHSAANGGCVEVGWPESTEVAVRDSKQQDGPTLAFTTPKWQKFLTRLG
jgi:hypothetical protein